MRQLGISTMPLKGVSRNGTRNTMTPPGGIQAANDIWNVESSKIEQLETPGDYWKQADRAREIWPIYGSNTGKYPDPIVSTIMDMCVSVTVAFGSENMLRDAPMDHPAKKVLDHWCSAVNCDDPMLTGGLDAFRKQFHEGRWCDGGIVPGWSKPESMKTFDGITYQAPKMLRAYPRTQFQVEATDPTGKMKLIQNTDFAERVPGQPSQEINLDEKLGLMQKMLNENRYQVVDRNRMESAQKYPIPFLVGRGLTGIAARIRSMQRGDFETVTRVLNALLLITQGASEWIEEMEWQPSDAMQDLSLVKSQVTSTTGRGFAQVVSAPYSTDMKWIMPDIQGLLSADKFAHDDYERLAALGVIEIMNTGQRRRYAFNPRPMLMEIWDAMQADRRFIEGRLFPILYEANPEIFKDVGVAKFFQKPVTIFMTEEEKKILEKLYEYGILTCGSMLEQSIGFGADIEAEVERHKYERSSGITKIVQPRVTFKQGMDNSTGNQITDDDEDDDDEESETAGLLASTVAMYDGMKDGVSDILHDDDTDERKKRAIRLLVLASIAAWGVALQANLRDFYTRQFLGIVDDAGRFEPYVLKTRYQLEDLGVDLLNGGKNGTPGLYTAVGQDDADQRLESIFGANRYRVGLFDREPFRVAAIAAKAAQASNAGMAYAVRHSAFSATTCAECINRHGEIMSINTLFAGGWDHPHGLCYFTYHADRTGASLEAQEMLSMDEINSIHRRMVAVEKILLEDNGDEDI